MKLAIFGASGATGQQLVQQALAAGHAVSALVRGTDSLPINHARLQPMVGSLDDAAAVASVMRNADAVISVLGVRKGGPQTVCADGMRNILPAMQSTGVRRLIALSAYGASETSNHSWFIRLVRKLIGAKMRDKDAMEALVRASDTDWTLVRPPALTSGRESGNYRSGTTLKPSVTGHVSRADLASFILHEAENGNYIRRHPVVSM